MAEETNSDEIKEEEVETVTEVVDAEEPKSVPEAAIEEPVTPVKAKTVRKPAKQKRAKTESNAESNGSDGSANKTVEEPAPPGDTNVWGTDGKPGTIIVVNGVKQQVGSTWTS